MELVEIKYQKPIQHVSEIWVWKDGWGVCANRFTPKIQGMTSYVVCTPGGQRMAIWSDSPGAALERLRKRL